MRSVLLLVMFMGMLPVAGAIPFVGVLLWCWITFMTPHQLVWGFSPSLRLNLMIAIATLLGWFFSKESKRFPKNSTSVIILLFILLTTLSSTLAMAPNTSWPLWERHIKTFALVFMVMAIMHNRVRIQALVWVIVVSIGYFSVQGGLIGIVSAGGSHISGPPRSQISDNNHLALAMVITLPLMNYLRIQSEKRFVQLSLMMAMALSVIGVLSTYSRGGLISLVAMLGFLWLKSSKKSIVIIFAIIIVIPAVQFMPDKWTNRMSTIKGASEKDGSFQGRIRAWETSFNLALDRPFYGGGFSSIQSGRVYDRYKTAGDPTTGRAAHSIYFQVLGDLGFVGLTLYLLLFSVAWRNATIVKRLSKGIPQLDWAQNLASMLQVSLVGFAVGGAALSLAYYDLVLTLIGILEILRNLVAKQVDSRVSQGAIQSVSASAA